ncbi:unnamed protein product [Microthlaspi erraticum]|uniref:C2 domain-containing protein n=1 Tax=Microthlaspi erraticum TaxID=1685480 RepID=A0A6D2JJD3_9BRAS|nr:unnamed protein product [Microthlaspi erraticum]
MESLKQASSSRFCYHQGFSGVLQVFVHNARNIHNICIYDNQDVYAKFSLTYNPDDTISTRIIHRAGKNPEFNQKLMIDVTQIDAAVLKCEIWMMSRARHYMEDQLLGFALVPISDIIGQDSVTQDYSLSSTDLFHSPAGTVKLTLSVVNPSLVPSSSSSSSSNPKINTSISSEVVLLDPQVSETVDYTRIEFPDINVVNENKQMVTEYFNGLNHRSGTASFLCLGSTHLPETDITMVCLEDKEVYGNGSFMASSSTTTSLSDDKNTANSNEKDSREMTEVSRGRSKGLEEEDQYEEEKKMNVETEETSMQKQIAEMYMRSMQQFTDSLAKMKLPMDHNNNNNTETHIQNNNANNNNGIEKKKEGSRVFYGSRAFF